MSLFWIFRKKSLIVKANLSEMYFQAPKYKTIIVSEFLKIFYSVGLIKENIYCPIRGLKK